MSYRIAALAIVALLSVTCSTEPGGSGFRYDFSEQTAAPETVSNNADPNQLGSIAASVAALKGEPGTLTLRGGGYIFTANYVIPENVTLIFDHGRPAATLAPNDGVIVSVKGGVIAADTARIKSGKGKVIFTKQDPLHAGWFGFSAAASGKENIAALRDAVSSMIGVLDYPGDQSARKYGQTVKLPSGVFAVDVSDGQGVPLNGYGHTIQGAGFATVLDVSGSGPLFIMNGSEVQNGKPAIGEGAITGLWIKNMALHHTEGPVFTNTNRAIAIDVRDVTNGSGVEGVQIMNFHTGIKGRWRDNFFILRNQFVRNTYGIDIPYYYEERTVDGKTVNGLIPQIVTIEGNQFNFPLEWAVRNEADFNDVYFLRNSFGGVGSAWGKNKSAKGYVSWRSGYDVHGQGLFFRTNSMEDLVDGQVAVQIVAGKSHLGGHDLTINNVEFSGNTMSSATGTTLKVERAVHLLTHTNMFGQTAAIATSLAWDLGPGVMNAVMLNNHYRDPDLVKFDPSSNVMRIMEGAPASGTNKPANPGPFFDLNGVAAKDASGAMALVDGNSKTFKAAGYFKAKVNGADVWVPYFTASP